MNFISPNDDTFQENWDFGESVKKEKLMQVIMENINKLKEQLKNPSLRKSSDFDDRKHCIDYHVEWDIPISFRARRISYDTFAKNGGSVTLRKTGMKGMDAEIYTMINGKCQSQIYVFIWSCGSYAIIDIKKWIQSGIIQEKLKKYDGISNKNKKNKFLPFTRKELSNAGCILAFHKIKEVIIKEEAKLSDFF